MNLNGKNSLVLVGCALILGENMFHYLFLHDLANTWCSA